MNQSEAISTHRFATLHWMLLCAVAAFAMLLALCSGSVMLSIEDIVAALSNGPFYTGADNSSLHHAILLQLRLPRALNAFALGGLLSLSGVYMQALLRNPLADPFVVGTSGGAAIAALLCMLLGASTAAIHGFAMLGAFAATLLVFALAHTEGSWSPTRLLLTGVIVAAGSNAAVTLLLTMGDESRLRSMLFWLMGEIDTRSSWSLWLLLMITTLLTTLLARHLNLLARGEVQAQALGMNVKQLRIVLFVISSVLTASVVTRAGTIGFIGLITPHLARLLFGSDHRKLVPAAVLLGGTLLTLADTAARTLFAPRQLPVGALTAVIGVPVFLFLMFARRRHP